MINIIYHADDLDGHASGAIAKHRLLNEKDKIKMWPFSYGIDFPEQIKEDEKVYILDFSFKNMIELYNRFGDNLVWIDHHQIVNEPQYQEIIYGYRDTKYAACYLTWMYFNYKIETIPEWLEILSDYDVWNQTNIEKWDTVILPFHLGIQLEKTDPKDNWQFWKNVFESYTYNSISVNNMVTYYINRGESIIDYLDIKTEKLLRKESFVTNFEEYKTVVTNMFTVPPNILKIIKEVYGDDIDLLLNFQNLNGKKWIVNLRSSKIDVSKIAKKYGGGGHKGAAGFLWEKHIEDLWG